MKVLGIIPSRYASTRFPGKPLLEILGKTMIQRVYEQCLKSKSIDDLIVATDDIRIRNHIVNFGGNVIITSKKHKTGTERCNEVIEKINSRHDIIINIQGDEPFINPSQIDQVVNLFTSKNIQITTLIKKITKAEIYLDTNTTKAQVNNKGIAIDFCRKIKSEDLYHNYFKHIGIYGYRRQTLSKICDLKMTKNEKKTSLEQLRWLDNNYEIKTGITKYDSFSVDVPNDIKKIKDVFR